MMEKVIIYTQEYFKNTFTNALQLINQCVQRGIFKLDENEPATIHADLTEEEERICEDISAGTFKMNIYDFANWMSECRGLFDIYTDRMYKLGYPIIIKREWWENDEIGWENGVYIGAEPDQD